MPSSDPITIPKIIAIIKRLEPRSILDVGCGTGKYGFLFREYLDINYGRFSPAAWEVKIDAVECDMSYITPVHEFVYNNVWNTDWLYFSRTDEYDVIFMGDVLEHWPEGKWQQALSKAKRFSKFTIVACPNWQGSIAQGSFYGHDQERHRVALTPQMVGGRCLFANSKQFITVFDTYELELLEGGDVLL
jgi:SAM-dependent methyltransferase